MDQTIRELERKAQTERTEEQRQALYTARLRAGEICLQLTCSCLGFPIKNPCILPKGHLGSHTAQGLKPGQLVGWSCPHRGNI